MQGLQHSFGVNADGPREYSIVVESFRDSNIRQTELNQNLHTSEISAAQNTMSALGLTQKSELLAQVIEIDDDEEQEMQTMASHATPRFTHNRGNKLLQSTDVARLAADNQMDLILERNSIVSEENSVEQLEQE